MTPHESVDDGDDVTMPAGGDVVADIRAHETRDRGKKAVSVTDDVSDSEPITVWTPAATEPDLVDVTVPFRERSTGRPGPHPDGEQHDERHDEQHDEQHSLIRGRTPPVPATSFWDHDDADRRKRFRASGMVVRPRRRRRASLGVILVVGVLGIVVISVLIAMLVTSGAQS